jgi:hypothetical protein
VADEDANYPIHEEEESPTKSEAFDFLSNEKSNYHHH